MKAVLLVGGLGTRLRSAVPNLPKALASVGGRPFLELIIKQLTTQGVHQLILCTGHLADQIEANLGDGRELGVSVEYSKETVPLGTAGAIKLAQSYLQGESDFLVLNGDSFVEIDLCKFITLHREQRVPATMAVVNVANANRYGTVRINPTNRITGFIEKNGQNLPGIINAGIYLFDSSILSKIPDGPSSLERDIFPSLLMSGVLAVEQAGMFIDIGVPEDYSRANAMSRRLAAAASSLQR
jgi:NDP-sugar pyrophosphorylase family protein